MNNAELDFKSTLLKAKECNIRAHALIVATEVEYFFGELPDELFEIACETAYDLYLHRDFSANEVVCAMKALNRKGIRISEMNQTSIINQIERGE
ncbi:MAG: hypothetical protein KBT06_04420 [Prevotellaceae bacterium]|nr:hypothetical protein [Candidatus Colivivens equi]